MKSLIRSALPLALLVSLLSACQPEPTPVSEAVRQEREDPKGNPLKGTVLDAQGEALKTARNLGDQMNQDAARKLEEADRESQ